MEDDSDDTAVPDVLSCVQEILSTIFVAMYNHHDAEERCYSDCLAELPEHDIMEGRKVTFVFLFGPFPNYLDDKDTQGPLLIALNIMILNRYALSTWILSNVVLIVVCTKGWISSNVTFFQFWKGPGICHALTVKFLKILVNSKNISSKLGMR